MKVTQNADGSVTTSFTLDGPARPVANDVVEAIDARLAALGEVMHAMDPARMLAFEKGGPPIWSVGVVSVRGAYPYWLLVTYGFSELVSPEPMRAGIRHEYSFAVPAHTQIQPWADALLRHQTRYILNSRAQIRVGDCIPLNGTPITRIPFQPEHHAMMPNSSLVGIVCAADPVVPTIATPRGPVEVRRLVGIDALELDRVETWSTNGFVAELARRDPLLLSPIDRGSWMNESAFRAAVDARVATEGSEVDSAMFDIAWTQTAQGVSFTLPEGRGANRIREAIRNRVGFGRRLGMFSRASEMIAFEPTIPTPFQIADGALVIGGNLESPVTKALLDALGRGARELRISAA